MNEDSYLDEDQTDIGLDVSDYIPEAGIDFLPCFECDGFNSDGCDRCDGTGEEPDWEEDEGEEEDNYENEW